MKDEKTTGFSLIQESQTIEEDFIYNYKNLPELWDTENIHYTNKRKRNDALDVLLPIIQRWNPSANRYTVRQKINILRSCFRKDLKKYLASKCIGPNGDEIYEYEPKSWKFRALRFLNKDKTDVNTIAEINLNDNNFDDASDGLSSNDEHPTRTSDNIASITDKEPVRPPKINSKPKNKRVKIEVEDDHYADDEMLDRELEAIGANVTCKLKRMNSEQRYHAELLINKVLITGLKNNLTNNTDLTEVYKK